MIFLAWCNIVHKYYFTGMIIWCVISGACQRGALFPKSLAKHCHLLLSLMKPKTDAFMT